MNKTYDLVAALVLRVGGEAAGGMRPLSWTELADVYGVTKDVSRHRVTRFKQKYNIVDEDVVPGWNRTFLKDHTPEEEKNVLANCVVLPGDTTPSGVVISVANVANAKYLSLVNDEIKINTLTTNTPVVQQQVAIDDTERRIINIVVDMLGLVSGPKNTDSFLDLGADSLDNVELVMAIEDEFAIEIEDHEAESAITIQHAIDVVRQKLKIAAPAIIDPIVIESSIVKNVVSDIEPLKFLITPAVLVVVRNGQPLSIDKSHKNFSKIQTALEAGAWQEVLDFIDMKNTLTRYSNGRVVVEGGVVTLDGDPVPGKVTGRLIDCLTDENLEGLEAISNFLTKCDENPDHRVVTRIYDFIAHNDLRLDKEGYILTYKVVRSDYLDKYTGTMDNSPGTLVQMKRNKVNPRDNETCSFGLHVAARKYIPQYGNTYGGDKVLLCKVHPKDFVSIPTDYNSMKARVCEYYVLKDVTENFKEEVGIEA